MTPDFQRRWVVSIVLATLALVSCARPQPSGAAETVAQESNVVKLWNKNVDVLEAILEGKSFQQEAFSKAVGFFEATTGIPSRDGRTFVGRIPNQNLQEDLARWLTWYAENAAFLYWDPSSRRIKVDEGAKERRGQERRLLPRSLIGPSADVALRALRRAPGPRSRRGD